MDLSPDEAQAPSAALDPAPRQGRVTLELPTKKSKHVRSEAQQDAFTKARDKAHSMLRAGAAPAAAAAPDTSALDRRMTELVSMTRLQLENERLERKVAKYRDRAQAPPSVRQPEGSPYNNLILSEIKRLTGR
jgi:hypothetical protein